MQFLQQMFNVSTTHSENMSLQKSSCFHLLLLRHWHCTL